MTRERTHRRGELCARPGSFARIVLVIAATLAAGSALADWPEFRGALRDGVAAESGLLRAWPEAGPEELWRVPLGEGFSGIAVVGDRLFTAFVDDGSEWLAAFAAADGAELWRLRLDREFVDPWGDGPRATPTVADGTVYAVSSLGQLVAADAASGAERWRFDYSTLGAIVDPYSIAGATPQGDEPAGGELGHSSSPLVAGDLLVTYPGALPDKALAVFDRASGELVWSGLPHGSGHTSPTRVEIAGREQWLQILPNEILALDPATRKVLWRHPWAVVTVSQPVFVPPDRIFAATVNDHGGELFRVVPPSAGNGEWSTETLWKERRMRNSWSSTVFFDGLLFGFDNATLRCLDAESGELLWARRGYGKGNLLVADGLLLVLSDHGELVVGEASAEGFEPGGRVELFAHRPTWTLPSLADGRLYARNQRQMVALDLRAEVAASSSSAVPAAAAGQAAPGLSSEQIAALAALGVEDVLRRAAEALGGDEAWRRIETLELRGEHTSFSIVQPFTLQRMRPDRWRFDHNDTQHRALHAYDGERAWWQKEVVVQTQGAHWPVEPPLTFQRAFAAEAEFDPPLIGWREKGHRWRLLGVREVDHEPYLELELTRGDVRGAVERWLLDPTTFLPAIRLSEGAYLPTQRWEQRSVFSDYREVAGVEIPHRVEIDLGNDLRALTVTEVVVDPPLDPARFAMPLPDGMRALRTLAGEWSVAVESRPLPVLPWIPSRGTSTIRAESDGALLVEELDFVAVDFPWKLRRTISWDRFRDVYRLTSFDNLSHHLDVREGRLEEGRLSVSNVDPGTPWIAYGVTRHTREVLSEIEPDSFVRVRETSLDGGATWTPAIRFRYTRNLETTP